MPNQGVKGVCQSSLCRLCLLAEAGSLALDTLSCASPVLLSLFTGCSFDFHMTWKNSVLKSSKLSRPFTVTKVGQHEPGRPKSRWLHRFSMKFQNFMNPCLRSDSMTEYREVALQILRQLLWLFKRGERWTTTNYSKVWNLPFPCSNSWSP